MLNQEKIGLFIAACRKSVGLTQLQLAEKLGITDRAVSKWERGKGLPDASIMLEVCDILQINVNELLCGERIEMENYEKELEKNLLAMIQAKEEADRRLLKMECVIGLLSTLVILAPCLLAAFLEIEETWRILLAFSGFLPGFVGFSFALKIEQVAGYYACAKCGHKYVPTYGAVHLAPHMGRTRYMTCPACGQKSWQKKVISKG